MPTLVEQQRTRGMLVTQGWPRGVCPIHMLALEQCTSGCMLRRRKFAQVARELADYFKRVRQAA